MAGPPQIQQQTLYQPLDTRRREFRLMKRVHSSAPGSHVLELAVFSLDQAPPYTALSYTWDTPSTNRTASRTAKPGQQTNQNVMVNDIPVEVWPNLHAFLDQHAHHRESGWYFIDALCIDQSEEAQREKESQVAIMGDIYRNAQRVVVWLGARSAQSLDSENLASVLEDAVSISKMPNAYTSFREYLHGSRVGAIIPLFRSMWWQRAWVVQEFLLAKEAVVWYSIFQLPWQSILAFLTLYVSYVQGLARMRVETVLNLLNPAALQEVLPTLRSSQPGPCDDDWTKNIFIAMHLLQYKRGFDGHGARSMPLHRAIVRFCAQRATVTHDIIYSLAGLTGTDVPVHYDSSVIDLYCRTLLTALVALNHFERIAVAFHVTRALLAALGTNEDSAQLVITTAEVIDHLLPRNPTAKRFKAPWISRLVILNTKLWYKTEGETGRYHIVKDRLIMSLRISITNIVLTWLLGAHVWLLRVLNCSSITPFAARKSSRTPLAWREYVRRTCQEILQESNDRSKPIEDLKDGA